MSLAPSIWTIQPVRAQNAPAQPKAGSTPASSGSVKYTDLRDKKVSLPYGEPFTITGDVADVQLSGGALNDLMAVTTVSGSYTDSDGTSGALTAATVTGTSWQVTAGKLAADTSATITLKFAGTLSDKIETQALKMMLGDAAYKAALEKFRAATVGRTSTETMAAAAEMSSAAADALIAALGRNGLTPQDPSSLRTNLSAAILKTFEPIYNLESKYQITLQLANDLAPIIGKDAAAVAKLSPDDLYTALKGRDFSGLNSDYQTAVKQFLKTYEDAASAFAMLKGLAFTATSSLAVGQDTETDIVSDLKKYAGFDVGALYSPRLSELRTFAMVNIYFGSVQLKTDVPPPKPGFWPALQQRVSLAFGMALKDISGASKSKITSEDAFVYGLGFRLNKYFRLGAGGLLYRTTLPAANGSTSPANGTLRQEFFVGPSIDVTAISALQSIFAKAKSN